MGIQKFFGVGIMSNRMTPCRGGAFGVRVITLGRTNARQGNFTVSVFDDDGDDRDLLAQSGTITVAGGGAFKSVLTFKLDCDGACNVKGPSGNSGETTAQVFAEAKENGVIFIEQEESRRIALTCVPPKIPGDKGGDNKGGDGGGNGGADPHGNGQPKPGDDGLWDGPCYPVPEDGGSCETARGVVLEVPKSALGCDDLIEVSRIPRDLDFEFFPADIGMQMRTLQIGRFETMFGKPIGVRWAMTRAERRLLDDLEGQIVRFDPDAKSWMPLDGAVVDDDLVSFDLDRGGLFAVAANARYNVTDGCDPRATW